MSTVYYMRIRWLVLKCSKDISWSAWWYEWLKKYLIFEDERKGQTLTISPQQTFFHAVDFHSPSLRTGTGLEFICSQIFCLVKEHSTFSCPRKDFLARWAILTPAVLRRDRWLVMHKGAWLGDGAHRLARCKICWRMNFALDTLEMKKPDQEFLISWAS